jgi:hypothetical protein
MAAWLFRLLLVLLWLVSTLVDRLWWHHSNSIPAWDQADYLNSALDHGRALGVLPGGSWQGWDALLDLSPKIPPLASLVNGTVMALAGDAPVQAAWSLSLWHGLLLVVVAAWALELRRPRPEARGFALLGGGLVTLAPALLELTQRLRAGDAADGHGDVGALAAWAFGGIPTGGRWWQALTAALACLLALLVKQSALLVLLPLLVVLTHQALWTGRDCGATAAACGGHWFDWGGLMAVAAPQLDHHPWWHQPGSGRSAAREGDPLVARIGFVVGWFQHGLDGVVHADHALEPRPSRSFGRDCASGWRRRSPIAARDADCGAKYA